MPANTRNSRSFLSFGLRLRTSGAGPGSTGGAKSSSMAPSPFVWASGSVYVGTRGSMRHEATDGRLGGRKLPVRGQTVALPGLVKPLRTGRVPAPQRGRSAARRGARTPAGEGRAAAGEARDRP